MSLDIARPGRDLGAPRRPELGEDVLDVAARRLGCDVERLGDLGCSSSLRRSVARLRTRATSAGATVRRPGHGRAPSGARRLRARQAPAIRADRRGRALRSQRHGFCVAVGANQALRQVDARPGASHVRRVSVPAGDRRLEGESGNPGGTFGEGDQPRPWARAAPATSGSRRGVAQAESQSARHRPAGRLQRPGPRSPRTGRGARARRRRPRGRTRRGTVPTRARGRRPAARFRRVPTAAAGSARSPARRRRTQARPRVRRRRRRSRRGSGDVAERPARHVRAPAAALVDDGVAGPSLASTRSAPAHDTIAWVERITWAQ